MKPEQFKFKDNGVFWNSGLEDSISFYRVKSGTAERG